jgi:hypothetical protein
MGCYLLFRLAKTGISRIDQHQRDSGITDVSDVPIPLALPLFVAGLGAKGLMSPWRKRKAAVAGEAAVDCQGQTGRSLLGMRRQPFPCKALRFGTIIRNSAT